MKDDRIPKEYRQELGLTANGQGLKVYDAAELLGLELPPPRWLVPNVLHEGVTLLGGKPKMGKSWLALGLCVAGIWNVQGRYEDGRWVPERDEDLECPVCLEHIRS